MILLTETEWQTLTALQQETVGVQPPTVRQIRDRLGITLDPTYKRLKKLKETGAITYVKGRARTWTPSPGQTVMLYYEDQTPG